MSVPVTPTPPPDSTNLAPANYTSTNVLDRVFSLILKMLQALQRVAVAQSDRLTFLTQWQKAYSDLMDQVHTFIKNNGDFIGGPDSAMSTARDDLNRLNTSFTEMMRNRRSLISDDSKALQSNVSQTNDAVNQQSTTGTTILQELSTILSSIYR